MEQILLALVAAASAAPGLLDYDHGPSLSYAPSVSYHEPAPVLKTSYSYAAPAVSYAAPAVSYHSAPAVSYHSAPAVTYAAAAPVLKTYAPAPTLVKAVAPAATSYASFSQVIS